MRMLQKLASICVHVQDNRPLEDFLLAGVKRLADDSDACRVDLSGLLDGTQAQTYASNAQQT